MPHKEKCAQVEVDVGQKLGEVENVKLLKVEKTVSVEFHWELAGFGL